MSERKRPDANYVYSGHFSVEDIKRDWLLMQGGRTDSRCGREVYRVFKEKILVLYKQFRRERL